MDMETRNMKQSLVIQVIDNQLKDFTKEEKVKILEEVMITNNIDNEVAGSSPGYSKPHSEVLSVL
jgi:uncharacterized protein YaaW (UPF0174 family)